MARERWFFAEGGERRGPLAFGPLLSALVQDRDPRAVLVWRRGFAESRLDLPALALRALELWRAEPDYMEGLELPDPPESGLLTGETGILLVACTLSSFAQDTAAPAATATFCWPIVVLACCPRNDAFTLIWY